MLSIIKFAGLAGAALKSNISSLKRPYKLNFSITYMCQSRCLTCNIWQIRPKGELSIDEIREFAAKNNYFRWIELTGGEPFLRSDIVEIAEAFRDNSKSLYILTFPTNSLCDPKLVERKIRSILDLGIPRIAVTVSLDGYRELHDRIRGVPGNFDRAIATYKTLQKLRKTYKNLYFVFGYTLSGFNQGQFQRTYEEVSKEIPGISVNDFHINLAQTSENYYKNSNDKIRPDPAVALNDVEWALSHRSMEFGAIPIVERAFLKGLTKYAKTGSAPMRSRSLEASLFMDSFGNIYPSIMWDRKIGNIRESGYDLSALWHNELAELTRTEIMQGKEPNCWTSCEAYQTITGRITSML